MKNADIEAVLSGTARLHYLGDLYECIGKDKNGNYTFQNLNDDSYIIVSADDLLRDKNYALAKFKEDEDD